MIVIIDGCGTNIASVQFALERLGKKSLLTSDVTAIKSASHIIIPGVNTAKQAMDQLKKIQLVDVISQLQKPVLGICSGMQILYEFSYENNVNCLGIFPGEIIKLPQSSELPIPHMGWNQLQISSKSSPLLKNIQDGSYVYYVHSFAAPLNKNTIAATKYGQVFSAIVQNKNFYGVQFHPERSGKVGETILKNFLELE